MVATDADTPQVEIGDEARQVLVNRFTEARGYGFTEAEAQLFAESDRDIGELRKLEETGCPPALAARILI